METMDGLPRALPTRRRPVKDETEKPASWAQRRDEVIATASRLMSEGGYRAISMERLAEELQVSKPTVYYYVDSKLGLWSALADMAEANSERFRDLCLSIANPREQLETLVRESVTISTGEMRWHTTLVDRDNFPDDMDPEIGARLLGAAQMWLRTVMSVVRNSVGAGILPEGDPVLTALNVIALGAWCAKWYKRDYDVEPEAIERSILDLLIRPGGASSPKRKKTGSRGK